MKKINIFYPILFENRYQTESIKKAFKDLGHDIAFVPGLKKLRSKLQSILMSSCLNQVCFTGNGFKY